MHVGPALGHTITENFSFDQNGVYSWAIVLYTKATSVFIFLLVEYISRVTWYLMKKCSPILIFYRHQHLPHFTISFCCLRHLFHIHHIPLRVRLIIRLTKKEMIFHPILLRMIRLFLRCRFLPTPAVAQLLGMLMLTRSRPRPSRPLRLGHHPLPRLTCRPHQLWLMRPTIRCLLRPTLPRLGHRLHRRRTATTLISATTHGGPRSSPTAPFPTVLPVDGVRPRWPLPSLARTSTPPLM